MRAAVIDRFGPPSVVRVDRVPRPARDGSLGGRRIGPRPSGLSGTDCLGRD